MSVLGQGAGNLGEYFGLRSRSYYHTVPKANYRPNNPRAYYLDFEARADFGGPFDENGLPLLPTPDGPVIFPTQVAMYSLGHLERYLRNGGVRNLSRFRKGAYWLADNQHHDGSWLVMVPNTKYRLQPPFRSAMVQGLAISVLTRAADLFESDRLGGVAVRALLPFGKATDDEGVTTYHDDGPFFEEYPCQPGRHVLNGFLYAMFGLYDLVRQHNREAEKLWEAGVTTLIKWLPRFDTGRWSLYQLPDQPINPATPAYHRLHINQLTVMAEITGDPVIGRYRDRWQQYRKNPLNALRTLPAKLAWLRNDQF